MKFDHSGGLALEEGGWGPKETSFDVVRYPIRIRILEACTVFDRISPVEMLHKGILRDVDSVQSKRTHKAQLSHVAYHCRILEEADCLELVDEQPVRGASIEHFYRATAQAYFSDEKWAELPLGERREISKTMWRGFIARGENSMMQDTFDARVDRWLAWLPLELDEQGWEKMIVSVADCYAEVGQIKAEAEDRLKGRATKPIEATFAIFAFTSPEYR